MNIIRRIPVPTGDILIVQGDHGKLECLSLGDYGKDVNVKCDAMGLNREPSPVKHNPLLPLEEKWVITISTQYGCSMACTFCDVHKVGRGRNASFADLIGQVKAGIDLHPEVANTKRLNLHYARMGEPTWNPAVLDSAVYLAGRMHQLGWGFHPVVSTMMPKNNHQLSVFLNRWMTFKNDVMGGNAGLQLSINSTNHDQRQEMFHGNSAGIYTIAAIMGSCPPPLGRKITLNFAVAGYEIDPGTLLQAFSPAHYIVKLTPMHKTASCEASGIRTNGDYTTYYPYKHHEEALRAAGFDVLVFIASKEEDEARITCGNAILSGTEPFATFASADLAPPAPVSTSVATDSVGATGDGRATAGKGDKA